MGIEIKHISKSYGKTTALADICLSIEENKIYGLFGKNGAGKTTLLNIINNRIFPTSGEIMIDGENAKKSQKALSKVYMMSESNLFLRNEKIKNLFKIIKDYDDKFDTESANALLKEFNINESKKFKGLSTGEQTIIKLIVGLCINRKYLIFDEPVNGLDANNRDKFYKLLLEKYIEQECTVIVSTHLIDEIANLVEEVIIVNNGKVSLQKSKDELLTLGYTVSGKSDTVESFIKDYEVLDIECFGELKTAYILGNINDDIPDGIEISRLNLQSLFIKLTSREEN